MTTLKKGMDSVQRSEKHLIIAYDEDSLLARLDMARQPIRFPTEIPRKIMNHPFNSLRRDKKNNHNVKQSENVYVLMNPNSVRLLKRNRLLDQFF